MSDRRPPLGASPEADRRAALRATVRAVLPNRMFTVETDGARSLRAHLAGTARAHLTRLVPGDEVLVELCETGGGECRIVGRPPGARGR